MESCSSDYDQENNALNETAFEDTEVDQDLEDQTQELKALGINVVNQISLEQNVAEAVDKAVSKRNREQKSKILKRELKECKLDIIKLKNKETDSQHRLEGMRQRLTDPRQFLAVEKNLKENRELLQTVRKRNDYIEEKLLQSKLDESVLDDVDLNLEDGEIVDNDDEEKSVEIGQSNQYDREKMIKEGQMTPFGTLLSNTDQGRPNKLIPKVSVERQSKVIVASDMPITERTAMSHKSTTDTVTSVQLKSHARPRMNEFEKYLRDQMDKQKNHAVDPSTNTKKRKKSTDFSYGNFKRRKPKPKEFDGPTTKQKKEKVPKSPLKKGVLHPKRHWKEKSVGSLTSEAEADRAKAPPSHVLSERVPFVTSEDEGSHPQSDSEYVPSSEEDEEEDLVAEIGEKSSSASSGRGETTPKSKKLCKVKGNHVRKPKDDGHLEDYLKRMKQWQAQRVKEKHQKMLNDDDIGTDDEDDAYEEFEGGFKIPLSIWNKLYKYQKTCVKWLWELHTQKCGGILGDEMGLGKTIMVISFLVGLSYSGLVERGPFRKGLGPVLIVCPATVLHQWVRECHTWWPPFRVAVLHDSGSFTGKKAALIHNINKHEGILIATYMGVIDQLKVFLNYDWHYVILDEGHKIRNPEAQITVAVKRFHTPHRIILSGSPIQNSLKELWSLFDFVFPGKLGTQPVFMQQFSVPITQGGYANATKLEVQTAFRCATVLRDTINPYLLRRMKNDVRNHLALPDKNEQVLFCGLSEDQRAIYRDYLDGNQVKSILSGRLQVFVGLINLRKICNHPDLYDGGPRHFTGEDISGLQPEQQYGWWKRAGKMVVLHSILRLWKKQEHRVLLFTQSRQMMCVLEKYLQDEGFSYLKMDGSTSVGSRQPLIQRFNGDSSIFVFLLTTRVGGLGVNLVGADRVVIYDPDWNPSTDTQARERAWRIGQKRHVTIYRLLTAGTIEEKIYHRQIFKQFLTNRVLKDPKQQRFFKTNDLYELFTLNEGNKEKTESSAIFAGTGSEIAPTKTSSNANDNEKTKNGTFNSKEKGVALSPFKRRGVEKNSKGKGETLSPLKRKCEERNSKDSKEKGVSSGVALSPLKRKDVEKKASVGRKGVEEKENKKIRENICFPIQEMCEDELENTFNHDRAGEGVTVTSKIIQDTCNLGNEIPSMISGSPDDLIPIQETTETERSTVAISKTTELSSNSQKEELGNVNVETTAEPSHELEVGPDIQHHSTDLETADEMKKKKEKMRELAKLLSRKISQKGIKPREDGASSPGSDSQKKRREKKSKKRERVKGKKFEGERIENLVKKRKFKYAPEDSEEGDQEEQKTQDEYVLRQLFKKSGVHTALSHDVILNSGDSDYLLLESEAEKVAKEALRQVRLSRARCFNPQSNSAKSTKKTFGRKKSSFLEEDTTKKKKSSRASSSRNSSQTMFNGGIEEGSHSSSEESDTVKRNTSEREEGGVSSGVLSSAQLLKRMRERKEDVEEEEPAPSSTDTSQPHESHVVRDPYGPITYDPDYPSTADQDNPDASGDLDECPPEVEGHIELLSDIRNFVAFQAATDGRASTQEIIRQFGERLPPSKNHIFKALLSNICDFVRESSGEGFWYIKGEFR